MKSLRRIGAIATVIPMIGILAGCGQATVISSDGEGTCDGKGDFTIATTQTIDASNYTITYDGPSNVSLVLTQGFYIDHVAEISGGIPTPGDANGMFWSLSGDDETLYALRLDPTDPGWTTTGSGADTHHEFSGTYSELLNGELLGAALSQDPDDPEMDKFVPAIAGVVCDDTITTGVYGTSDPATMDFIDTIQFQAAAPVDPNHLLLDPMVIDTQTRADNVLSGTAHFPASTADIFGDFVPDGVEFVSVVPDADDFPNDTFSELWFQELVAGGSSDLTLTFPDGLASGESFPWRIDVADGATTGNYIVFLPMAGTVDGEPAVRVAFMNLYFDAENGVAFLDPIGEPDNPDLSQPAELAATGVNSGSIALVAMGLLGAGVVVAGVRRRRL